LSVLPLDPTEPACRFAQLPLSPAVLQAVERCGYQQPTPIQAGCIPHAMAGRDVIGQAQTGTGKTAAFLLPFLSTWKPEEAEGGPYALVLAPTRELVVQVADEVAKLAPEPSCRAASIIGGQRMRSQLNALKRGVAIVIGTPGRVLDHLKRGTLSLDKIRYVVLDEADRMLDIGFRPDIERILKRTPTTRQTMLFSATMPPPVMALAQRYMIEPVHVNMAPEKLTVDKIRQTYLTVDEDRKFEALVRILQRDNPRQAIIFCERKRWVEEVYFMLRRVAQRTACMHGDLSQSLRNRIMRGFREGKIRFLVATDVVGRGIDVKNISHVINYDLPEDPENYVHRIGRTGRIGADGIAIAFVTPEQGELLTQIESYINREIPPEVIEGFQGARPRVKATPIEPKPIVPVYGRRVKKYSNRL